MGMGRTSLAIAMAGSLAACGGGGSGSGSTGSFGNTPTPTGNTSNCSLSARQDFVKTAIDSDYLFPDLVDNSVNKANYSTLQSYIDALVAPARAQRKDRYFTYVTSIAEENAYYSSGANAGFGVRLAYDTSQNRVFVVEAFENAPALSAGIDRGTEIIAIGTVGGSLQTVSSLMASGGAQAVVDALGPSTTGTQRVLRVNVGGQVKDVTIAKTDYSLDPVSDRYGAVVLDNGGKKVGYINLRTFITPANTDLRSAFATFKAQGITEVIIDLRYNGGGLVSVAETLGDLMAADKVGKVFGYVTFRPSKASRNETDTFGAEANAIAATKIAFIGYSGTASASELVANAFPPYLGANTALVGGNTYGKPVGQEPFDKAECDDRLRLVTFKLENADHNGEYFNGLAATFPKTCAAGDDITHQLGDPNETAIKAALDFLGGRTCTPITVTTGQGTLAVKPSRDLLEAPKPTAAQRETPGLF